MLNERFLSKLPVDVVDLFADLETTVIDDICRRIAKAKYTTDTAAWQIYKMEQLGYMRNEIDRLIAVKMVKINKELANTLFEAVDYSLERDNTTYRKAYNKGLTLSYPLDLKDDTKLLGILDTGVKQTQWELKNFTRTSATYAGEAFIKALDSAWLEYTTGAFTREDAVRNAVIKLGRDGLQVISYTSGRRDQVDVAVRRAVVTGANKTYGATTEQRVRDMGTKLVWVSQHMGARPSHESWQGKVYYFDTPVPGYESFKAVTGYGQVGADYLMSYNCRHSYSPFYEGISTVTEEPYNKAESDRLYALEQKQRALENNIRHWKRRASALKAVDQDSSKEDLKVREWQKKLNSFTKENGLTKQYARTRI